MYKADLFRKFVLAGVAATLAGMVPGSPMPTAQAEIMGRASHWYPPKHPTNTGGYEPFIKYVEEQTKGEVKFKLWGGSSLLGPRDSLPGVENGVADVTCLALIYFPAEFPYANLFTELSFSVDNPYAASAAITELTMLHCPPCVKEFTDKKILYTGGYATSPYVMMSKTPLTSAADLKGKRYRSNGNIWDRWVKYIGGTPTNVSSAEIFSSMNGGGLDAAIFSASGLESFSIWDVAKYVDTMPLGIYSGMTTFTFNRGFWQKLNAEQRKVLLYGAALGNVYTTRDYVQQADRALKLSPEHGVKVGDPTPELLELKKGFIKEDAGAVMEIAKSKYKLPDPSAYIAKYQELIGKWSRIADEVNNDPDKMVEAMRREIYDKVDVGTYGLQ